MSTRWYLAKYVPDLRRGEPRNIGVIVLDEDGEAAGRFYAERDQGAVDGRTVRGVVSSVDVYRQWLSHWHRLIEGGADAVDSGLERRVDDNYYLEVGGEFLLTPQDAGHDRFDVLDDLYTSLVDDTPDTSSEDVRRLSDRLIGNLPDSVATNVVREAVVLVRQNDVEDELWFDYRYSNGQAHLMQRVGLTYPDQRSWDRVHAVSWSFDRLQTSDEEELREADCIALVKPRADDAALQKQLRALEELAHVVDVTRPVEAVDTLKALLGPSKDTMSL